MAGVTKGVCGSPLVARAMLEGGVRQLADSRLENLARLKRNGIQAELILLRLPMLSEAEKTVRLADISLNSELPVIRCLSAAAMRAGRVHQVVLMLELGDLREGVDPAEAVLLARRVATLPGIRLAGVGVNLTCYGGVVPSPDNLRVLAEVASDMEQAVGFPMGIVSGGNTSSLPLMLDGRLPEKINHLRLGEALLLGLNTVDGQPLPGARQDAFVLRAEIIEVKTKRSMPVGKIARDAFGRQPQFVDRGDRRRAILAIGREDVLADSLSPLEPGVGILGASSDHLLVDVQDSQRVWVVGEVMSFRPGYGALLAAMTSSYVAKRFVDRSAGAVSVGRTVALIGAPSALVGRCAGTAGAPRALRQCGVQAVLERTGWRVHDIGDIETHPGCTVEAYNDALAEAVAREASAGRAPVVFGGTHTISRGIVAGVRQARPHLAVVLFAAHADVQAGWLAGLAGLEDTANGTWLEPENLAIIGVRDIDPAARETLKRSPALVYTMEEVDYYGIRDIAEKVAGEFAPRVDGLHVSLGLDVLDPGAAPAAARPASGGISAREAYLAMEILSCCGVPLSMDLLELDVSRDRAEMTTRLAVGLVATLFGKRLM